MTYDNAELIDLLRRLIKALPNKKTDYSGVGWCAGCGAVLYAGDGSGADPCKSDCVLQEALSVVNNAPDTAIHEDGECRAVLEGVDYTINYVDAETITLTRRL